MSNGGNQIVHHQIHLTAKIGNWHPESNPRQTESHNLVPTSKATLEDGRVHDLLVHQLDRGPPMEKSAQ